MWNFLEQVGLFLSQQKWDIVWLRAQEVTSVTSLVVTRWAEERSPGSRDNLLRCQRLSSSISAVALAASGGSPTTEKIAQMSQSQGRVAQLLNEIDQLHDEAGSEVTPSESGGVPPMGHVSPPTMGERWFNKIIGALVGLGLGPRHMVVLEVRGRKSGRVYATPVDVLDLDGRRYLVAPRGHTAWSRNAAATGSVVLRRGRRREACRVRPLSAEEKPAVLKVYLERFKLAVQSYFPVTAGAPASAFVPLVDRYPAFELIAGR
jgi:deazaflavin-dependent oxidoreductase (nitroreductase family)